jgi:hypothetical protein
MIIPSYDTANTSQDTGEQSIIWENEWLQDNEVRLVPRFRPLLN